MACFQTAITWDVSLEDFGSLDTFSTWSSQNPQHQVCLVTSDIMNRDVLCKVHHMHCHPVSTAPSPFTPQSCYHLSSTSAPSLTVEAGIAASSSLRKQANTQPTSLPIYFLFSSLILGTFFSIWSYLLAIERSTQRDKNTQSLLNEEQGTLN